MHGGGLGQCPEWDARRASVQVTVRPSVMAFFDTGGGLGPTSLCPAVHLSMLHE